MEKVICLQDESSHWYVIPNDLLSEFNRLLNLCEEERDLGIENLFKTEEEFNKMFSKYRTGGDLNNIQLYAEI